MQFTLTDDHKKQEQVWKAASGWQREPHQLRKLLLDTEMATSDPLVMFAGLDAYHQAGGELRPDLFSDDGDGFITSVDVLNELAAAKLEAIAAKHRAAGWSWVETPRVASMRTLPVFGVLRRAIGSQRIKSAPCSMP